MRVRLIVMRSMSLMVVWDMALDQIGGPTVYGTFLICELFTKDLLTLIYI